MADSFGSWFKQQREAVGISIRDAASVIQVDRGYLSRVENDRVSMPTFATLWKFGVIYRISPLALLETFLRYRDWHTEDGLVMLSQMTVSQFRSLNARLKTGKEGTK